jgi:competence protein ComEA
MRFLSSILLSATLALSAVVPAVTLAGPVDINTADAGTLARELNGIGPSRAQAIVAYRTQHGPFKTVDDLALVKNIPQKIIDSNRELLQVGGKAAGPRPAAGAKPDARAVAKTDAKAAPAP